MTSDDKNELFWTIAVTVISAIIGSGIAYGVFCALKKRIVIVVSSSGLRSAAFSRDSQPISYWSFILLYTLLALAFLSSVCFCLRSVLVLVHN
jgi:hypothetical protein